MGYIVVLQLNIAFLLRDCTLENVLFYFFKNFI